MEQTSNLLLESVESSNIQSLGFTQIDERSPEGILAVKFKSSPDTTYLYLGVPQSTWLAKSQIDSAGKFVQNVIKKSPFPVVAIKDNVQ